MKSLLSLVLLIASIQVRAQTAISWMKSYSGTIGKTPFTMLLHKAGNDYDAYVYYTSTQLPYHLSAQSQTTTTIVLTGAPPASDNIEKWVFKLEGKKLTGSFILNNKTSSLTAEERNFEPAATYVYTQKSVKLYPSDKKSPQATYYQSGFWYTNNSFINKVFWSKCGQKTAGQCMIENRNEFINSFKEEHKGLKPSEYKDATAMYSREEHSKMLMSYVSKDFLVFSNDYYTYSGGAHGMFGTAHWVIDMRNEELLQLGDIIMDSAALSPIITKRYRQLYNVPEDETLMDAGLFTNEIPANENFFLTQKGIGFTYTPYEIAPYAGGQITIFIPYGEFKHLVTDYAKGLFSED